MSVEQRLYLTTDSSGRVTLGGPWAMIELKGGATTGQCTATSSPCSLAEANPLRKCLIVANTSTTDTLWIAESSDVNPAGPKGFPVPPTGYFVDNIADSAWWVVAEEGKTIDVRWIEASNS